MAGVVRSVLRHIWHITRATATAWAEGNPFRQSAVVAYYAIFSIPPLLVIVVACAGLAFGREAVQGHISAQITAAIGSNTAEQVEEIIRRASERKTSVMAAIISGVTLVVGATAVFAQLQYSLNRIWEVRITEKKKLLHALKDRLFSFGLIVSVCFLMLVSLLITTALEAMGDWIRTALPPFALTLFKALNVAVSTGVITMLFALIYLILPDATVKWRDVWVGAFVTALLFLLGKWGLGVYFGKAQPASTYGTAGSIVLIMLWVSYSSMIVLFGAEFTKQYATHFRHKIVPRRGARLIGSDDDSATVAKKRKAVDDINHEQEQKG